MKNSIIRIDDANGGFPANFKGFLEKAFSEGKITIYLEPVLSMHYIKIIYENDVVYDGFIFQNKIFKTKGEPPKKPNI